jgi:hypothetical protein
MWLKLNIGCLLMALMLFISFGVVSASVQTFESDIGTVEIDLPYTVEPGDFSSGSSLSLVKPGTTKPIISININDVIMYNGFQDFAESFIGPGHTFKKMVTNDGEPMLFNVYQDGTNRDGNPTYTFRGYIDYSKEKGKYIILHAPNDVRYQGETIATYTEAQFAAICQSFVVK